MNPTAIARVIAMATLLLSAAVRAAAPGEDSSGISSGQVPRISAYHIQFFRAKTGAWSEEMAPNSALFRNSSAGPDAIDAVLIVVQVTGAPNGVYTGVFGVDTRYMIRLLASEEGRKSPLADRVLSIPVLSEHGSAYLPLVIYPSGCKPVRLTGTVVGTGARKEAAVQLLLPFSCGE